MELISQNELFHGGRFPLKSLANKQLIKANLIGQQEWRLSRQSKPNPSLAWLESLDTRWRWFAETNNERAVVKSWLEGAGLKRVNDILFTHN